MCCAICWAAVGLLLPEHATGQTRPDADIEFYLFTIGPGDEVHELFGHNALLQVTRDANGKLEDERMYNWGVFDFQQKNFIFNFIQGRMIYRMEADSAGAAVAVYRERQRYVRLRHLELSPEQATRLAAFCANNDTDANRNYRYDYYRDNCSTRVRDALDEATSGQVKTGIQGPALSPDGQPVTYRWHTDRLTPPLPWLYCSLHYVMGHPIDRPLSRWEETFLPERLEDHLKSVSIKWEDGTDHALLGREIVLVPDTRGERDRPPAWGWIFALVGLAWGALAAGLGRIGLRRAWPRYLAGGVIALWALACVAAGGVSTWSWLFTDHVVARANENWLQLSPLSIGVLVAGLSLIFRGKTPRWATWAAALTLALSLGGWMIKLLPGMIQPNWSILMLALPVHAGVLLALLWIQRNKGALP
jgi:hypothetical protein